MTDYLLRCRPQPAVVRLWRGRGGWGGVTGAAVDRGKDIEYFRVVGLMEEDRMSPRRKYEGW